jgi:hypothetical protein
MGTDGESMTKPHEETWTTHEYEGKILIDARWALSYELVPHAIRSSSPTKEETNARATLAGQAPAMARILEGLLGSAAVSLSLSEAIGSATLDEMRAALRAAGVLP